jgi:hypothetical protein
MLAVMCLCALAALLQLAEAAGEWARGQPHDVAMLWAGLFATQAVMLAQGRALRRLRRERGDTPPP